MKSAENKKIIIQRISVKLIRFLFVFVMILMVSIASNPWLPKVQSNAG